MNVSRFALKFQILANEVINRVESDRVYCGFIF